MSYIPDDGESKNHTLMLRAIDYLEMYFEELRGSETDREWSDLEHEVMDVVLDIKELIGEKD